MKKFQGTIIAPRSLETLLLAPVRFLSSFSPCSKLVSNSEKKITYCITMSLAKRCPNSEERKKCLLCVTHRLPRSCLHHCQFLSISLNHMKLPNLTLWPRKIAISNGVTWIGIRWRKCHLPAPTFQSKSPLLNFGHDLVFNQESPSHFTTNHPSLPPPPNSDHLEFEWSTSKA